MKTSRKLIRVLKWGVYSLIVFEAIYVLSTLVFFNCPSVFNKIVAVDPKEIRIQLDRGWSWIPGVVHLRNYRLEGEDRNVDWVVELPEAKVWVRMRDLLQMRFHAEKLKGEKVSFKLRMKSEEEKKDWPNEGDTSTLEERRAGRWKIQIENVDLGSIHRLQVGPWIYQGKGQINGSFYLLPGTEAQIGPARLHLQDGAVLDGKDAPLMEEVFGNFEVRISKFLADEVPGNDVLKYLSMHGNLDAQIRNFKVLNRYFESSSKLHIDGGSGKLTSLISVVDGKIQEGSQFSLESPIIQMSGYGAMAEGKGSIQGQVQQSENNLAQGDLQFCLKDFRVFQLKKKKTLIHGQNLSLLAKTQSLGLVDLFSSVSLQLNLPDSQIPDVRSWFELSLVPLEGFHWKRGGGVISARLYARSSRESLNSSQMGHFRLSFPRFLGTWKDAQFSGDLNLNLAVQEFDLAHSRGHIPDGSLELSQVAWKMRDASHDRVKLDDWWLRVGMESVLGRYDKSLNFSGRLQVEMKDTLPIIYLYQQEKNFKGLQAALLKLSRPQVSTSFETSRNSFSMQEIQLDSDSIKAAGKLSLQPTGLWGKIRVKYGVLSAGLTFEGSNTQFSLFPH